jgi:tetratricopeptide (TPR) repeat protein
MRANSLLLACFLVLFLAAAGSHTVLAAEKISADDLLLEALKAEKAGGDSVKVMEKFEAVVKADPENYYALIKLGMLKSGDGKKAGGTRSQEMDATEYFLRATLARPSSPEAYLYLAQLNYRMGYITEGDRYLKMSQSLNKHIVYDDVCLTGWRYEDTGNYYAAVLTYAAPAISGFQVYGGSLPYEKVARLRAALATSIRLGHPCPQADGR